MNNLSRVCAEIDLDAISNNMQLIQNKMSASVAVLAVIKANGYGHGAVAIAQMLARRNHVFGFAVATVSEAVELRREKITQPILVLGASFSEQYEALVEQNITQTVFQLETAQALSAMAVTLKKDVHMHLKVDTGMGRIGFAPTQDNVQLVQQICALPNVVVDGIFSHFATADEADKSLCCLQQQRFFSFLQLLDQVGITVPYRHLANSAGIIELDNEPCNMVRAGIMLYGLYPSDAVQHDTMRLQPAFTLRSHITYIKTVKKDDTISYGATYTATNERRIATVPVGYADGYSRQLSGRGHVLIHGQFAPIVGRICMDQMMVDVSEILQAQQGDPVVLVGSMGNNKITVEEVAELAGSFNYEFVCNINQRVPRVYFEAGAMTKVIDYLD